MNGEGHGDSTNEFPGILNLSGVSYMDSAGIGELVACFKRSVKYTTGTTREIDKHIVGVYVLVAQNKKMAVAKLCQEGGWCRRVISRGPSVAR